MNTPLPSGGGDGGGVNWVLDSFVRPRTQSVIATLGDEFWERGEFIG